MAVRVLLLSLGVMVVVSLALNFSCGFSDDVDDLLQYEEEGVVLLKPSLKGGRKLLGMVRSKELLKGLRPSWSDNGPTHESLGWNLRKAPSGPDPLHHNANKPRKPQTP